MNPFVREEPHKEISEINVVPLADVSLVLLIILLVLSPMMTHNRLMVRAAGRQDAALPAPPEDFFPVPRPPELVLAVAIGPNGFSVGAQTFPGPGELMAYLTDELSRRSDKKVFLAPHPDTAHGLVVHALEMIKSCGAETVSLVQTLEQSQEEEAGGEIRPAAPDPTKR